VRVFPAREDGWISDEPAPLISQRAPVEVLNGDFFQIDSFEAANIDRGHPAALWIRAFAVRLNAAGLAKAVLDHVLVERISADILFRGEQAQLIARHKPEQSSFARTQGAIARHRSVDIAFYLERNLTAVTATFVLHVSSPFALLEVTEKG
jgi:hypothetical protein